MLTFKDFMREVDGILIGTCGLDSMDLPDQPYRCWYDDEVPAKEAAMMALEDSGAPDELMEMF